MVFLHESRPVGVWLIFDVGQKMKCFWFALLLLVTGCYRSVDESERVDIWTASRDGWTYAITRVSYGGGCATTWLYSLDVRSKISGVIFRRPLAIDDDLLDHVFRARLDAKDETVWVAFRNGHEMKIEVPERLDRPRPLAGANQQRP